MKKWLPTLLVMSIQLSIFHPLVGNAASEPNSVLSADSPMLTFETFINGFLEKTAQREDIEVLLKLKNQGIQQIAGEPIDIVLDRARATKIKVEFDLNSPYINSNDGTLRKSARWEMDKDGNKTIFLSLNEGFKSLKPPLMIHESLGTADRNFAPSTFLQMYFQTTGSTKMVPNSLLEKMLNIRQERGQGGSQLSGTSGVGGGGDYRIQFHMYIMYLILFGEMLKGNVTAEQIVHFTCFVTNTFDFDISSKIDTGHIQSEIQTMPDGTQRIKILLPDLANFSKIKPEIEIAKNLSRLFPLTKIMFQESSNACFKISRNL